MTGGMATKWPPSRRGLLRKSTAGGRASASSIAPTFGTPTAVERAPGARNGPANAPCALARLKPRPTPGLAPPHHDHDPPRPSKLTLQ